MSSSDHTLPRSEAVADPAPHSRVEWVIEPRNTALTSRALEVWISRYLLGYFAARALERRMKGSWIKTARFFLKPIVPVVTYTVVFNGVAGIESGTTPYFLFVLVGLAIWQFFAEILLWTTRSLQMNSGLLTKLYFPRILLPAANMSIALAELLIHCVLIIGVSLFFLVTQGVLYLHLGLHTVWALIAILFCLMLGLGIGLFTSIFGARTPDLRYTLPYVLQLWLLITPVVYPLNKIPEQWRWLASLNPMTTIVELFKVGVLNGGEAVPVGQVAITLLILSLVIAAGLWFFGRAEAESVDQL